METENRIPVVLITGFLGAGKTTLLNNLLKSFKGLRTGLMVNDFGEVPVDGSVLRKNAGDNLIYEIGNGSIFCSCLKSNFIFGLKYFQIQKPDVLFIETSGLSDPSGFGSILCDHRMNTSFSICSIICLIDASRYHAAVQNLEAPKKQVRAADIILINKSDLLHDQQLEDLRVEISSVNASAEIQDGSFGVFELGSILSRISDDRLGTWESCNTIEERPETLFIETNGVEKRTIVQFIDSVLPLAFRLKGVVNISGKPVYVSDSNEQAVWETNFPVEFAGRFGLTVFAKPGKSEEIAGLWSERSGV
ncbi:MAG: GTP-binding protein [Bacteroidetes bacterium]|nr:GTP-binding protein [Bacteroidota bacterium]